MLHRSTPAAVFVRHGQFQRNSIRIFPLTVARLRQNRSDNIALQIFFHRSHGSLQRHKRHFLRSQQRKCQVKHPLAIPLPLVDPFDLLEPTVNDRSNQCPRRFAGLKGVPQRNKVILLSRRWLDGGTLPEELAGAIRTQFDFSVLVDPMVRELPPKDFTTRFISKPIRIALLENNLVLYLSLFFGKKNRLEQ